MSQARAQATTIHVRPNESGFGAEITGLDISKPLPPETLAEVKDAWARHAVVWFPDQPLTHDQLEAFTLQIGPFGHDPFIAPMEDHPHILELRREPDEKAREAGVAPRAILKADRDNGAIRLDTDTQLTGIPPEAFDYRLGNRSGLDWILDQYKEKTPRDPTIREKFNTYRFADYKEKVIDLIARVTRVSVETVAITQAMKNARR